MKDDVTLARWLNGEMDENELREFMASPGFETYSKIKEYSAQLTAPQGDMDLLYNRIEKQRNKRLVRKLNPWVARIAAVLVIALSLTMFFYATHTTTVTTAHASRSEFLLPDDSQVVLNAGTEVEYRKWNWQNNREIELDGEAFFKVAKGKTFDVITDLGTITVVGTQFNVKERGNRLEVSCFEGKVKVSYTGKSLLLLPGKSIIIEHGKGAVATINIENNNPGWINNEAEFYKETLEGITKEIERQYNVEISIPLVPVKRFTGTIPTNDLNTALDIVKTVYHLKSERAGNKIILSAE
jgi:ferric-dicitrate binding protein FerR (iron transport regulator)